jgi:hypothetical protein
VTSGTFPATPPTVLYVTEEGRGSTDPVRTTRTTDMRRNLPTIIAVLMSVALIVTGVVMLTVGLDSKTQVTDQLAAEQIITPDDATIPGVPVNSAATAKAQADIIQHHVLESTGGKTYAQLDREDPARATYLNAVTLRTSLMSAYMAFKIADLVTGLGALFLALGLGGGIATGISHLNRRKEEQALTNQLETEHLVTA